MADDDTSDPDPVPDPEATDEATDASTPATTRVARERYVRSGWGVLFAVGVIAGVVIATGDIADFDTAPFCTEVAAAADATTASTPVPAPGAPALSEQASDLAASQARLAQYQAYVGTVPYDLEDELDLLIDRDERLVAAIEALGPDATREELDAAVRDVDGADGLQVQEAIFALDVYASDVCDLGPELVD